MTDIITQWRQREVIAEVSGWVVDGMEAACQFAETQAKGRAPVRTGLTKADIRHEVRIEGNSVVGYVGVFKGNSKAFYAKFVEFGTKKMRARPFIRPAIFENRAKIVKLIAGKR